MKTILYLSPHLDDVVFSCSGHLRSEMEKGNKTIVATIFTKGDHDHRKEEDKNALTLCGAEYIWLDKLDAPFRNQYYNSFERLIFGNTKNESIDLEPLIRKIQPDQVIAPLAVGTHIDHRIVFDACKKLTDVDLLFYADRPYSLIKGATELRLHTLGYQTSLIPFEQFWDNYLEAKYVKTYLKKDLESVKERLKKMYSKPQQQLNYKIVSKKLPYAEAILSYHSQRDAFISEEIFNTPETLFRLTTT